MFRKLFAGIFMSGLILSCACTNNDQKTGPEPVVREIEFCAAAQSHLEQMCYADPVKNKECCDIVRVTPKQRTFEQVCHTIQQGGIFVNAQCISTVTSCAQVDSLCMQNEANPGSK